LALDTVKLQTAMTNNVDQIAGLFASLGTSTDALISVKGSTSATKSGSYVVNISNLATKGSLVGNVALNAGNTTILSGASATVTLDGTTASVPLVAGSFNATALASMLQSAINGVSAFSSLNSAVVASIDSNVYLNVTSKRYGSASNVTFASGNNMVASDLFGAAPTASKGIDVAGSIGGYAATGSGQTLTANGGADPAGLQILIADNATGGTVNFSQGYAYQLNNLLTGYTQNAGLLAGRTTGLNASISDVEKQKAVLNTRLTATEKRYRAQFTALDTSLSQMNSTSSYLTQQLASLAKLQA
jgi:flagellar hook-associated protein 2